MQDLLDRRAGKAPAAGTYPTVTDGVWGMRFIEACLESNRAGSVWKRL